MTNKYRLVIIEVDSEDNAERIEMIIPFEDIAKANEKAQKHSTTPLKWKKIEGVFVASGKVEETFYKYKVEKLK